MTTREAIAAANDIRPNALDEKVLAAFLHDLDVDLAETLQVQPTENRWPEDQELLMPAPGDRVYILWLCCQIDWMQLDMEIYQIDQEQYAAAYEEAIAWYRRHFYPRLKENGARVEWPPNGYPVDRQETEAVSGDAMYWDPLNQRGG